MIRCFCGKDIDISQDGKYLNKNIRHNKNHIIRYSYHHEYDSPRSSNWNCLYINFDDKLLFDTIEIDFGSNNISYHKDYNLIIKFGSEIVYSLFMNKNYNNILTNAILEPFNIIEKYKLINLLE